MSGKTVLYVEDNEFNRKIVCQLLVATALEAQPDLILMDIQLPKLSGLDATRQLRRDPRTAGIPIIVVTSFALVETTSRRSRRARPCISPSPTVPVRCWS